MSVNVFHKARYWPVGIVLVLLLSGITSRVLGPGFWDQEKPVDDMALIEYGKELIEHTSVYLGPHGTVMNTSNGMNCQNCHLQSGTKFFGNNYSAVAATYPKFRPRSGTVESIEKRINDCIERSLNGTPLDEDRRELKAMAAYILWVGRFTEKGKTPEGGGIVTLPFLDRAASPANGRVVYAIHCKRCHGGNAEGLRSEDGEKEWLYPPLAGADSYNTGAGLYRISKFAGFVKANMPYGVSYETSVLSDEEAWDVAAYINSLPRPEKTFVQDWPDIATKPFDHPFGPYSDQYNETTHKFGPFTWMKREAAK